MHIVHSHLKKGEVKLGVDTLDDIWYLSMVIDAGDTVTARTLRKIKVGGGDGENQNVVRKPMTLSLTVDKVEFSNTTQVLRIGGTVIEGPEDVPHGSHHTFAVEEGTILTIVKERWLGYQLQKLDEACEKTTQSVLVVVMDREDVDFALLHKKGYEMLSGFSGEVEKKEVEKSKKGDFYAEIIKKIEDYVAKYSLTNVIIASPAFFKEDLMKEVKDTQLRKMITLATCNGVGQNAVDEVLKRPELKEVLRKDKVAQEMALVEELFTEISRDNLAAYGMKDVRGAAEAGAIRKLLVSDALIFKKRDDNTFIELDRLMRSVEQAKGEVFLINSEHDGGKQLDGIGGIGAILRYKMRY